MSLYLEYRPNTFEEVKGNERTIPAIRKLLDPINKAPHTWMFSGPTGCGKTTLARILAKELGCDAVDLNEVNSANFRGVDMVRDVIYKSQFMPTNGVAKVWIIDEVHMLTTIAQNAFLKILEDTPDHIYFILCTTDSQKLAKPFRDRCQTFKVEALKPKEMLRILRMITRKEESIVENSILEYIIKKADGIVRDAIQILEQVLATDEDKRLEAIENYRTEEVKIENLCVKLFYGKPDWMDIAPMLKELKGDSTEPETIRRVFLGWAQSELFKKDSRRAAAIMEAFEEPMYDILFPGVTLACYRIVKGT